MYLSGHLFSNLYFFMYLFSSIFIHSTIYLCFFTDNQFINLPSELNLSVCLSAYLYICFFMFLCLSCSDPRATQFTPQNFCSYFCLLMYACLSTYQFTCLLFNICLSNNLILTYLSIFPSLLPLLVSIYLSLTCLLIHLSLSTYLSLTYLSTPPVNLPMSIYLPIFNQSIYLCRPTYLPIYRSSYLVVSLSLSGTE